MESLSRALTRCTRWSRPRPCATMRCTRPAPHASRPTLHAVIKYLRCSQPVPRALMRHLRCSRPAPRALMLSMCASTQCARTPRRNTFTFAWSRTGWTHCARTCAPRWMTTCAGTQRCTRRPPGAFATADVHGYCVQVYIRDMCAEIGPVCGVPDNDARRDLAHYVVKCERSRMNCGYNITVFEVECYSC